VNKDLYDKEYQIPPHIVNTLRNALSKYGKNSTENVKRVKELTETGKATYQQLKRIKNWFDSNQNTSDPEFHLLGGGTFKGWVNQTLDSDRGSIDLSKKAKSITSLDNQYLDSHEKDTELKKHFRPSYSHKKSGHKITGIKEQVNRINDLIKKIL
jgi:hypothetical protein